MRSVLTIALSVCFAFGAIAAEPVVMVPIQQPTKFWTEVQSASQPVEEAAKNVVRVTFSEGVGTLSAGSGVYLGERLIATAYHVLRGTSGIGRVHFRDGAVIGCRTIQIDKVWDQCILELDQEHPTLPGVEIANYNPKAGDIVYSSGFGAGFRIFGGRVTGQWARPDSSQPTTDWYEHMNPAIPGDSGGPMFTESGLLIGCLWGTDGQHTTGTGGGRFNVFVRPLFPRIAQWRADRIGRQIQGIAPVQQGGCANGQCPPQQSQYQGGGRSTDVPSWGNPTPITPNNPIAVTPPTCVPPAINQDQLIAILLERMGKDDRFRGPAGPAGAAGADGKDGKDGANGAINEGQLSAITQSILQVIRTDDNFRGPAGPPGDGAELDIDALTKKILAQVMHPPQRVVLLDGSSGKIIDDETYQPGEPIVLDFQAIIKSAAVASNARYQ